MSASGNPTDPPDRESREQLLARAIAEFLDRQAREEDVDLGEYCAMHPDLAPDLREELEELQVLDTLSRSDPSDLVFEAPGPLPERLSGHKVVHEIGAGGMGRVLLGMDEALGRPVAIKMLDSRLLDKPQLHARFTREARALARLNHPNIVRIYNLGPADEPPHFVMEYVEGLSLSEAARRLTIDQKVELLLKVVLAVDVLHRHRIIHRDLKPGNIIVGRDLEPKVLDFGLAQQADQRDGRLTLHGEVVGTRDYFSPEQARGELSLDARSDIFSLGAVLYEVLTGAKPFRGATFREQVRQICEEDPSLPRRIDPGIPGDLQNICLKAMEKKPSDRYGTAREMADDLKRYLAGEAVLASPTSYSRLMSGKIEQHLRELEGWKQDEILSAHEVDAFRKLYDRLVEREDAWILEVRRLSLSQVTLYLGAWILVIGAALVVLFLHSNLSGTPAVVAVAAAAAPAAFVGIRSWRRGLHRTSIAYLLAFCLLLPSTLLVAMEEWRLWTGWTLGREDLEFFAVYSLESAGESAAHLVTNAQMWWAAVLSLPAYFLLRRFTGASVFSLVLALDTSLLCLITLLRLGLLEWLETDPGRFYFHLLPAAAFFFVVAMWMERRGHASDSRYFYPFAMLFTFAALSGLALFHEPYAEWLRSLLPATRGQVEYLFILNAGLYYLLQRVSDGAGSAQMRTVAKTFRFVIPGHVLVSIFLLGTEATRRWGADPDVAFLRWEARIFEILLPSVACLFVLGSIPKQMKNYLATGLLFLAVGFIRLQQNLLQDRAIWPVGLLAAGLFLMYLATHYTPIKLALTRWYRRR